VSVSLQKFKLFSLSVSEKVGGHRSPTTFEFGSHEFDVMPKKATFARIARYKVGPVTRDCSRVKTPLILG